MRERVPCPFDLDRLHTATGGIGDEPARRRARAQGDVRLGDGGRDAARLRVTLRTKPAREGVARPAEDASAGLSGPQQSERQRRGVQTHRSQPCDEIGHVRGVRDRGTWKWPTRRFRRIRARLAMHVVHRLGPVVVRRQRVVVDRPRGRDAVFVFDDVEILASKPIEHGAPELGVAADVVVGVGPERVTLLVEPLFSRSISQLAPHDGRVPVGGFTRNHAASFQDQDGRTRAGERASDGAAARATADDHDVEVLGHDRAGVP